jgi:integrase
MPPVSITPTLLSKLKPATKPYFVRDSNLQGFGLKVNPSGSVKFIAEVKYKGKSKRKTVGTHPVLSLQDAKSEALSFISGVKSGTVSESCINKVTLQIILDKYVAGDRLKPRTVQDYQEAIGFYLSDWMSSKVSSITKQMVERRFYRIRDKGINGGIPTYSQATKVMRILSALMNYAMADETIESNPVQVLKQKRIDRSIVKRTSYLPQYEARKVLEGLSAHPVEIAMALMFYTGLRKNEALSLRWEDVSGELIRISDTKNHREHLVPITGQIQAILDTIPRGSSPYMFPSPVNKNAFIKDVRPTLKRVIERTGITFRCHDLRRTFATRASEVGIDYLMIKRLLNHKTNDITAQYIQWDSKQNLEKMKEALEKITY